jgi:hypothetical protein
MRAYWLFTVELVPVDHEYCGQSVRKHPNQVASKARVIESPVDAIEFGSGTVDACAGNAEITTAASADPIAARRRSRLISHSLLLWAAEAIPA